MQDLHLVGFTKDRRHLIFSTRKGAKSGSFLVPVDSDLVDAVDEVASYVANHGGPGSESPDEPPAEERPPSRPRVESSLSVKEVQTRLRAGEAVDAIASDAGVDPDWVERFATPIRAEQRRVVERAMSAHLQRPRAGKSAVPLRQAIAAAMAERKIHMTAEQFESAWQSHVETPGRWVVQFTFPTRGKTRTLEWDYEIASGRLTTSDRFASQLGFRSADDLPSDNSSVDDASTAGGRRSGGLAIPGTTKASPASPAYVPRHPGPPSTPRRPMPPPPVSAMPPRPSAPPTPPATPRAVDGRPPQTRPESPVEPRVEERPRPASGGSPAARSTQPEARSRPAPGGPPRAQPQQPESSRRPRDRRRDSVETPRSAGPAPRRPDAVSPGTAVREPSVATPPARPAHPPRSQVERAPAAPMAPMAPAPQAHPHRDPAPPVPARRPAPMAPDAERTVDEGDAEIAPSLRVISTVEESSVRLIPPTPSDDTDEPDREPEAVEPGPPVEDEAAVETEEDIVEDDGPDDDDADHEDAVIEDDLDEAAFDEEDADDEDVVVEDDLDEVAEDVDDTDDAYDEGELDEAADEQPGDGDVDADEVDDDDLEAPEQPAIAADRDASADDADAGSAGDDVETEAVDRRARGRVRFATESDRRSKPAGQIQGAVLADDDQPGDDETPDAAPASDTIAWSGDEPDRLRLRPMGEEDLHPRRRDSARRSRRSQPIVARRDDDPSDEPDSAARETEPESRPRRSSAQFKAGFAKVAGADDRIRADQPAPDPRRESQPVSEPTGEAEQSGQKAGIDWPEGGRSGGGEPQPRRRESSRKPQSSGKKTRRRRSQPLRAR